MHTLTDILESGNEMFSLSTLTDYVNSQPFIPEYCSKWLKWESEGVSLPTVTIDFTEGSLSMIPEAVRGAPGDAPERDVDSSVVVKIPHFPQRDTLYSESLVGSRMSGSELEETFQNARNKILKRFSNRNRLMWEVSRIGAISGLVINHKGQIARNWFDEFEIQQTKSQIDFNASSTKIRSSLMKARDLGAEKMGDLIATEWVAICGKNRFDSIIDHPDFEKAVERWNDGAALRDDLSDGFKIASDIKLVKYARPNVAGQKLVGDNDMYLCPVADGMYQTRFAPGTGFNNLGSIGLPEYVSPHILPHDEGVELKGQTNVISYAQRLEAIVKVEQA